MFAEFFGGPIRLVYTVLTSFHVEILFFGIFSDIVGANELFLSMTPDQNLET